jgi:hypothetical protein
MTRRKPRNQGSSRTLVSRQLHDELDAAVAGAYGWSANLPDAETLQRLAARNTQRAPRRRKAMNERSQVIRVLLLVYT